MISQRGWWGPVHAGNSVIITVMAMVIANSYQELHAWASF